MYDWIVEADIYRLSKAIAETDDAAQRARLLTVRRAKEEQLGRSPTSIPSPSRLPAFRI